MESEPRVQPDVNDKGAAQQITLDEMYAQKQRMLDEMRGANQERAQIVKWLRSEDCFKWLLHNTNGFTRDQAANLAYAIDQGEQHRITDDKEN